MLKKGRAEFLVDGASRQARDLKAANGEFDVELFYYDGDVYSKINGELFFSTPVVRKFRDAAFTSGQEIGIEVSSGQAVVDNISIRRDVYYRVSTGHNFFDLTPFYVPKDLYVVIGDNVAVSHDSRAWKLCSIDSPVRGKIEYESQSRDTDGRGNTVIIDRNGNRHVLKGYINYESSENYPFVHRKYIVGKALVVWWPTSRWFNIIR
jgi:hypothetical protein